MKKIAIFTLVLSLVIVLGGNAFAASTSSSAGGNSLKQGTLGLNFDVFGDDNLIFGKFFVMNDLAVLAGFGLGVKGGDAEGTDVSIAGGVRKYFTNTDFAPFAGGLLIYRTSKDGDQTDLAILGQFGAEYFLAKQFSVEGSVGFGYMSNETKTAGVSFKDTTIGTSRAGFSINFYF